MRDRRNASGGHINQCFGNPVDGGTLTSAHLHNIPLPASEEAGDCAPCLEFESGGLLVRFGWAFGIAHYADQ
jgi:hypothetical protein